MNPASRVSFPLAIAFALAASPGGTAAAPDFTQHLQFGQGSTIPVAWGDAEGDGDQDLAVGNVFGEQNLLYRNDGSNAFVQENAFGQRNTFAIVWGDCDNDGDLDAAVGNGSNQANRLVLNQGDGTFIGRNEFARNYTVAMAWSERITTGVEYSRAILHASTAV